MKDAVRLDLPSASKFEIIVNCPGQQNLIDSMPSEASEPSDEDASRGTLLHKAWETNKTDDLDDEDLEIYQRGGDLKNELRAKWCIEYGLPVPPREGQREARLWFLDDLTGTPLASGQLDAHFISPPYLLIVDYKSLWCRNLTPARKNWQLRLNAVLGKREYDGIQFVRVGFLKPSVKFGIDWTDYSPVDLEYSEASIRFHLWASRQKDAQRRAGTHCRYCPGKAFCPEAGAYAMLPRSYFDFAPQGTSRDSVTDMVESLTLQDLLRIWKASTVISKILEAVKLRLKGFPDPALEQLGIARIPGRTLDPIVKTKELFDFLKGEGFKEEELWTALSFSKTELQKALMRDQGWSADPTRGYLKQKLVPYIDKKSADGSLVTIG